MDDARAPAMSRFPLYPAETPAREAWGSEAYAAEVRAFVEDAVGPADLERTKLCGWSTVWRVEAARERYWFKQNCRLNAFEARLLAALGDLLPGRVAEVVAHEPDSGMLLTRHHGEVHDRSATSVEEWAGFVAQWAVVQRDLLAATDDLIALGVPVLTPTDAAAMAAERIDLHAALPDDDPLRLAPDDAARAREALPRVREALDRVAALDLPLALNHNDLHDHNVFVRAGDQPYRFFDLGDAMLTDPAAVLVTPLRVVQDGLSCAADDPRVHRVADAWVEVWSDVVPAADLRAALPASLLLGLMARHDSWLRATTQMDAEERADWGDAPAVYLAMLADPPILR